MEPPTFPRNHLQTWTEGKLMKLLEEDSFECISQSVSFHVSTSWQVPDIQLVFVQEGSASWNTDVWGMLRTSTFSTFEATFEILEMWSAPCKCGNELPRGACGISTMKCHCDYDSLSNYHKHQALTVYFLFPYNPFKKTDDWQDCMTRALAVWLITARPKMTAAVDGKKTGPSLLLGFSVLQNEKMHSRELHMEQFEK